LPWPHLSKHVIKKLNGHEKKIVLLREQNLGQQINFLLKKKYFSKNKEVKQKAGY